MKESSTSGKNSRKEDLRQEIQCDYSEALKGLPMGALPVNPPAPSGLGDYVLMGTENSKNSFKEVSRVIQRNLLRCHPLIHRPAVHLRSKLSCIQLNIVFEYVIFYLFPLKKKPLHSYN